MDRVFDALADLVPDEHLEYDLFLAHPTAEWDSASDIKSVFGDISIEFSEDTVPDLEQETLVLFHDGELITASPVQELTQTMEIVNKMIKTGEIESLESITLPSVLAKLTDSLFDVRQSTKGHPELLFTTISRHIEARACERGEGRLRVGFQRLSRLKRAEENHTRRVYNQLAALDVDVHVYGIPDWVPPKSLEVKIHGGYDEDFVRNWFVVYQSADGKTTAAFLAHERKKAGWRGHWTFDTDRVGNINRYLEQYL